MVIERKTKKRGNSLMISILSEFNAEAGELYEPMEWNDIYKPQGGEWDI